LWIDLQNVPVRHYFLRELSIANKGTLFGVPLLDKSNRKVSLEQEIHGETTYEQLNGSKGKTLELTVAYLDHLPTDI
jgi:hypothetical protein